LEGHRESNSQKFTLIFAIDILLNSDRDRIQTRFNFLILVMGDSAWRTDLDFPKLVLTSSQLSAFPSIARLTQLFLKKAQLRVGLQEKTDSNEYIIQEKQR
jgi:hypothetical protein